VGPLSRSGHVQEGKTCSLPGLEHRSSSPCFSG